jgi:glyoxylase-like metal-dependent hydrolase (beta-lactamase superfamily II)
MQILTFTGGIFDTNGFYLEDSGLLIDAPQGIANWLAKQGKKVTALLLTHGHIDHIQDAAQLQREHGCAIFYHADGLKMLTERDFFKSFGFGLEVDPITPGTLLDETPSWTCGGHEFEVLLVPGHCPGSLCFLEKKERTLFGGDVLFAGGVGRWDLPGGDRDLLFTGIKTKLFPLGDDVKVLPGHGPATTIGHEQKTNPYLVD